MMVSPAFASLFGAPHLYQGQLIGSTVPSIVIILFTNLFYGGLVGSILTQFRPKAVYQPQKTTETRRRMKMRIRYTGLNRKSVCSM